MATPSGRRDSMSVAGCISADCVSRAGICVLRVRCGVLPRIPIPISVGKSDEAFLEACRRSAVAVDIHVRLRHDHGRHVAGQRHSAIRWSDALHVRSAALLPVARLGFSTNRSQALAPRPERSPFIDDPAMPHRHRFALVSFTRAAHSDRRDYRSPSRLSAALRGDCSGRYGLH